MARFFTPAPDSVQAHVGLGVVRHHRLRPIDRAFAYGAAFLMLPLRTASGGKPLTGRWPRAFGALGFSSRDHGDGRQDLARWVDEVLTGQGIRDANGALWLQAFPRVFGHTFKPVSFWYCHRPDGALRAIVCEVNNTFGERHVYVLDSEGRPIGGGQALFSRKAFHVSPFCDVKGGYTFRFHRSADRCLASIAYDDGDGVLLATSLSGRLRPLGRFTGLFCALRYPLFTWGVVVRIHWQAARLWWDRVPFHAKPPRPSTGVSR